MEGNDAMTQTKHSPMARRAALAIINSTVNPALRHKASKVTAPLLAEIIDRETAAPELLEAVKLWRQFFDDMPKGQFANISCDIGLMNDAFIKSRAAIAKATGKKG